MAEAEISKRAYVLNAIALMILLGLTIGAAELALGPLSVLVALLIAGTKAVLVALIFMHLKIAGPAARIFAAVGLIWLVILIGLTISDFATRGWIKIEGSEPPGRWQQNAPPTSPSASPDAPRPLGHALQHGKPPVSHAGIAPATTRVDGGAPPGRARPVKPGDAPFAVASASMTLNAWVGWTPCIHSDPRPRAQDITPIPAHPPGICRKG